MIATAFQYTCIKHNFFLPFLMIASEKGLNSKEARQNLYHSSVSKAKYIKEEDFPTRQYLPRLAMLFVLFYCKRKSK